VQNLISSKSNTFISSALSSVSSNFKSISRGSIDSYSGILTSSKYGFFIAKDADSLLFGLNSSILARRSKPSGSVPGYLSYKSNFSIDGKLLM
jgi:hypothetical protein